MKQYRSGLAAVLYNDHIIAIGGHNGWHRLSSVECYSFDSKTWMYYPCMTTPREGHSAVCFDDKIYVIGGYGTNTIEFYHPIMLTWTLVRKTYIHRYYFGAEQI